jgi:hypothetical protein
MGTMSTRSPRRSASASMMEPACASPTSQVTSSNGSIRTPPSSLQRQVGQGRRVGRRGCNVAPLAPPTIAAKPKHARRAASQPASQPGRPQPGPHLYSTIGGDTDSSMPSRRMFSTSTPSCSSPRACTSYRSPPPPASSHAGEAQWRPMHARRSACLPACLPACLQPSHTRARLALRPCPTMRTRPPLNTYPFPASSRAIPARPTPTHPPAAPLETRWSPPLPAAARQLRAP